MALHLLKAYPYIGLNVFHQVAEMNGAIGIGQGAGNQEVSRVVWHLLQVIVL